MSKPPLCTLFSRYFAGPNLTRGRIMSLTVSAKQPASYYEGYPYFAVHCSTTLNGAGKLLLDLPKRSAHEWLHRSARAVRFADLAGLKPTRRWRSWHDEVEKIQPLTFADHISGWTNNSGSRFLLFEPYHPEKDWRHQLHAAGMIGFVVPTELAPYKGGDMTSTNWPMSTSLLCTRAKSSLELYVVESALNMALENLPNAAVPSDEPWDIPYARLRAKRWKEVLPTL